ncbi:MAG: hypothetical protein AAF492_33470, partial [Verrucomicrobiota bacterium]
TVQINGAPQPSASTRTHFIRDTDGHNRSSGSLVYYLDGLSAGDEVSIHVQEDFSSGLVTRNQDALLVLQKKSSDPIARLVPSVTNVSETAVDLILDYDFAGAAYDLMFYWGYSDGGTNPAAWLNAPPGRWITNGIAEEKTRITGLSPGTRIYFAWRATNCASEIWSDSPRSFLVQPVPPITASGFTQVGFDSAELSVILGQGNASEILLFWGEESGGTDTNAWDHTISLGTNTAGSYTFEATGLAPCSQIVYRAYVTNALGGAWSPETVTSVVASATPSVALLPSEVQDAIAVIDATDTFGDLTVYYGETNEGMNAGAWAYSVSLGSYADGVETV